MLAGLSATPGVLAPTDRRLAGDGPISAVTAPIETPQAAARRAGVLAAPLRLSPSASVHRRPVKRPQSKVDTLSFQCKLSPPGPAPPEPARPGTPCHRPSTSGSRRGRRPAARTGVVKMQQAVDVDVAPFTAMRRRLRQRTATGPPYGRLDKSTAERVPARSEPFQNPCPRSRGRGGHTSGGGHLNHAEQKPRRGCSDC
jgi:hypothetical protein